MFDDLKNSTEVNKEKTEDIFAGVEKSAPLVSQPKPSPFQPVESSVPENVDHIIQEKENKKYFIIGITVLVLLILASAAWFVVSNFSSLFPKNKNAEVVIPPAVNNVAEENQIELVPNVFVSPEQPATTTLESGVLQNETSTSTVVAVTSTVPVIEVEKDTDGDGLMDKEEALLSTNPLLTDSDGDGLSDYDEVKIHKTDPLKADTDGDSYKDGDEIKNGYNPLGAGKLIQ